MEIAEKPILSCALPSGQQQAYLSSPIDCRATNATFDEVLCGLCLIIGL